MEDAAMASPTDTLMVPVSLQLRLQPSASSRSERKLWLLDQFETLAAQLESKGVRIDLGSVSPSAQTVKAEVPREAVENLTEALDRQGFRLDLTELRQVVPPF